jgi:energy-coupling factor transport system permease protein
VIKLAYVAGDRGLHRLHPTAKAAWLAGALAWTFLFESIPLSLAITAVMLAGAMASGVWRRLWPIWLAVVVPFGVSAMVIHSLFNPANTTVLFEILGVHVYREGALAGGLFASRVAILSSAFLLFILTTDPRLLMNALVARGFNPGASYAVLAALDLPPELERRTRRIWEAQQARGLDIGSGFVQRAKSFVAILGPLVGGALVATETRTLALEARGFSRSGTRSFLREPPHGMRHQLARWAGLGSVVAAIVARVLIG